MVLSELITTSVKTPAFQKMLLWPRKSLQNLMEILVFQSSFSEMISSSTANHDDPFYLVLPISLQEEMVVRNPISLPKETKENCCES